MRKKNLERNRQSRTTHAIGPCEAHAADVSKSKGVAMFDWKIRQIEEELDRESQHGPVANFSQKR